MSRRKNLQDIMNHRQPEDVILDLGGCPLATMQGRSYYKLLEYMGLADCDPKSEEILKWAQVHRLSDRLMEALDIDTRGVGATQVPKNSTFRVISDKEYIDEFSIRRIFTGLYWDIIESPLREKTVDDLKDFPWPDPDSIDLEKLDREAERAKWLYENTDYIVVADLPVYGVFELGCWMCGFDDYLCKVALDEDFIHEFSSAYLRYQKRVTELYLSRLGPYIHIIASGDDFATQHTQFISPDMFDRLVAPYFKERLLWQKQFTDAINLHHSCGSVYPMIPKLKECGVEMLNPIQPGAKDMEPEHVKNGYGDIMVFHGGFDTQEVLPFGTPDQIESAVQKMLNVMNRDGGYVFAAAHNIQEDVPPENIVTMFKAARKFGHRRAE